MNNVDNCLHYLIYYNTVHNIVREIFKNYANLIQTYLYSIIGACIVHIKQFHRIQFSIVWKQDYFN